MAKNSLYDKPADQWSENEIEVEKLRLEAARAKAEGSIGRRYGTIILSGVLAVAGSLLTYYTNMQADNRQQAAQNEETERTLAQNAVRVYFENPERFDLKTEEGKFNLRVLADTAPGKTTATLVSQIQDNAVQIATANAEIAAASPSAAAAVAAGAAPSAPAPAAAAAPVQTYAEAKKAADDARYSSLANVPAAVENASRPSDFKVFVQYGTGAQERAAEAQKRLQQIGYGAPAIQLVTTPTTMPELRYFRQSQARFAEELALQLKEIAGGPVKPAYFGDNYKIADGIMEFWLPPQGVSTEQAYRQGSSLRSFQITKRAQDIIRQESNKGMEALRRAPPPSAE